MKAEFLFATGISEEAKRDTVDMLDKHLDAVRCKRGGPNTYVLIGQPDDLAAAIERLRQSRMRVHHMANPTPDSPLTKAAFEFRIPEA